MQEIKSNHSQNQKKSRDSIDNWLCDLINSLNVPKHYKKPSELCAKMKSKRIHLILAYLIRFLGFDDVKNVENNQDLASEFFDIINELKVCFICRSKISDDAPVEEEVLVVDKQEELDESTQKSAKHVELENLLFRNLIRCEL